MPTIPIEPFQVAPDTWLVSELVPAMPGAFVPIRSAVIAGREPVVIDTGTSYNRHAWTEAVFSIVDPADVRWIFVSHDDHDHVGNLSEVLAACPNATLLANWFFSERLVGDLAVPLGRTRWINAGDSFDAGDRVLTAVLPPIFDSPTTRGLFDPTTGFYWAADGFCSMVVDGVHDAGDLPADLWEGTFREMNRQLSPWLHLVDTTKYAQLLGSLSSLGLTTIAGAHGSVLSGAKVGEAFDVLTELPAMPPVEWPGQPMLDELLAARSAGRAAAA